ncbi:alpha,alpha-phosphotrehalase, partial [Vibrio fluvialis]|nr:alpha,alpha-phosphotrehalase [Vibrio fluvialis]
MQGTPYIYQGEEIGMTNPGYTSIEQYRDVESINMYDIMVNQGTTSHEEMMAILAQKSRDNSRTPMQWNAKS